MLQSLLYPDTVAVIGASGTPGKVGHAVVENLVEGGFKGRVVPINPRLERLLGLPCHENLAAFGESVDLAVIAVPTAAVKAAVKDSIKAGARSIVVITAGFKEVGHAGAALEDEIVQLCHRAHVRMVGPNCLGVINSHHGLNASFAAQMPSPGGISIISQSGALCTAILDWAAARHLGLAKLLSVGNKADLNEIDFLEALGDDDDTKVIVAYLESITSGDEFVKVAQSVSAKKPVVVLKVGTSRAGERAASSHTGSLAGADMAYGAAFRRAGVIRAESFEDLMDAARAFAMQPMPRGNRVAIITNAGGPGIMAADAVENLGMTVAVLGSNSASALRARLPSAASVGNPIDVLGDANPERYAVALNIAQEDSQVDAVIVLLTPQAMTWPAETARAIAASMQGKKPVVAAFMGGKDVMPGRDELVSANLPDYPSPERAARALKVLVERQTWLNRPPRVISRFPVNRRRAERIIGRHLRTGRFQVNEVDGKSLLRAYNFNVPSGQMAYDADEAVEIAFRTGFPVAMKIVSPDIMHKSDFGGVRLGLASPEQVRDAFDLMMLRIGRAFPQASLEGVYVERMAPPGREVIMGMNRDPQFGPMLMFGLGGIFVEVMKDVTFHLAPITAGEAMQMLEQTRSYALLRGVRGQAAVDLDAIAGGLQRISQLVTDFPVITELDINPFIVGDVGHAPMVADVRMTLAEK